MAGAHLPFEMHSDPADRILVATALHLGATLVTADQALLELSKEGHFRGLDAGKSAPYDPSERSPEQHFEYFCVVVLQSLRKLIDIKHIGRKPLRPYSNRERWRLLI